jgi:hypothetical protein
MTRDLQKEALLEQARQFNINSTDDMTKYFTTLKSTLDQFNVGIKEQHNYAAATLKLQAAQVKDSDIANYLNFNAGILQSPVMLSLDNVTKGTDGLTELGRVVNNLWNVTDKKLVEALTSPGEDISLADITQVDIDSILELAKNGDVNAMMEAFSNKLNKDSIEKGA